MEKLEQMKQKLEKAEKEKIAIEAKISFLTEDLKNAGFSNVEEANESIEKMAEVIEKMEDTLERMINEFESKYNSLLEG
jgi:uncharacterized protein (UPF0335 family)